MKSKKIVETHVVFSEETSIKLRQLAKQNGTNSIPKTLKIIVDQYLTKEGMFNDPVNNVFLREFKTQTTAALKQLIEASEKNFDLLQSSINELNSNMREEIVVNKEKNTEIDLLNDKISQL